MALQQLMHMIYVHVQIYIYMYKYVCMYVCMYVCIYVCTVTCLRPSRHLRWSPLRGQLTTFSSWLISREAPFWMLRGVCLRLWCICIYEMLCAIWYHLYNFKNVKNTHGGMLILVKLQAKVFKCSNLYYPTVIKITTLCFFSVTVGIFFTQGW